MRLLWLTNIPLPEASKLLNEEIIPFGGWLVDTSFDISQVEDVSLSIAFPNYTLKEIQKLNGENIVYYSFPSIKIKEKDKIEENLYLKKIIEEIQPDIVHIFGTELAHSYAMVNICKKKNIKTVISIQGLVSMISKHYTTGLPTKLIKKSTFRNLIKRDNIYQQQKKFAELGRYEIEAIKNVSHIIGRTTWDRACTFFLNKEAQYYYCNETLREIFYHHQWDLDKCEKYTIFLSQGSYPIKGLHFMVEALKLVLTQFPEARLYIGGSDITKTYSLTDKLKITSYGKYINKLINKNNLQDHIIFSGILDETQMCERYLKSHVFVCPSTVENSPNSLGEAMILGLPSVSADVGGISDLLTHKEEGFLYQSDAPYMLAYYICKIFQNNNIAINLSKKSRLKATKLHNKEQNLEQLLRIYRNVNNDFGNQIFLEERYYDSIS